uniref:L,D-TPase catalytic domain-containing protein n=1 Tax=Prevotella sp. GTC17262 TaxID=3236797 RepID=A0AB33JMC0_9BACT
MKCLKFVLLVAVSCFLLGACNEKPVNPNRNLSLESFSSLDSSAFSLNSHRIREYIDVAMRNDADSMKVDYEARRYYRAKGAFVWIDRLGVDHRASQLLEQLKTVSSMGFSEKKFSVSQIEEDLARVRALDFDSDENQINKVYGRLEYHLTKAYFRFASGQRFGYVNPRRLLNSLDVRDSDSVHVSYRQLFDVGQDRVDKSFYRVALRKVRQDSVAVFLKEITPKNALYTMYLNLLNDTRQKFDRMKILCNLERARWRTYDDPSKHQKYVLVNIPAFRLMGVDGKDTITMRVGCGSLETKTPLLSSQLERMDVNPRWVLPASIVKKSVAHHAGDSAYFARKRFSVIDRHTGKKVSVHHVTAGMLMSGRYYVVQTGGVGNSLGRIIFRFNNNFAVYLHDTSQRDFFNLHDRGVSHGCVRVERPFDLAVFLLAEKDGSVVDKIKYSMSAPVGLEAEKTDDEETDEAEREEIDRSMLIRSVPIAPKVPLYITYYTLYQNARGVLEEYPDVYGYDRVLYGMLKNFGAR